MSVDPVPDIAAESNKPGRGVYWLPNLLTTGTLFGGFYAVVAAIDFDYVFNSVSTAPRPVSTPAAATTVDFDKVFASIAGSHRMNTPPNRERLRNIGWRRILGS